MRNLLLLLLATPCLLAAPPMERVPYAQSKPQLTAQVEDPAWSKATILPALLLSLGADGEGLKPSPTEVRLLWDEQYLYARFVCHDDVIEAPFQGRDQPHYKGDVVELFLDPTGDGRHYVEVQLSPENQIFDQQIVLDAAPQSDEAGRLRDDFLAHHFQMNPDWNMEGLRTATRKISGGWIAELAIPALSFDRAHWQPATLRAHLMRYDWLVDPKGARRLIAMNWAPVAYGCPHISPEAMGSLQLLPKQ